MAARWRERARALLRDLSDPTAGRIGVVNVEPSPQQRRAARLTVIPMLAGIIALVLTNSWIPMLVVTVFVAFLVNLAWRAHGRGLYM